MSGRCRLIKKTTNEEIGGTEITSEKDGQRTMIEFMRSREVDRSISYDTGRIYSDPGGRFSRQHNDYAVLVAARIVRAYKIYFDSSCRMANIRVVKFVIVIRSRRFACTHMNRTR